MTTTFTIGIAVMQRFDSQKKLSGDDNDARMKTRSQLPKISNFKFEFQIFSLWNSYSLAQLTLRSVPPPLALRFFPRPSTSRLLDSILNRPRDANDRSFELSRLCMNIQLYELGDC